MGQYRKGTLLIVEDSTDLQDLTKELFESEGYDVYCVNNGQEALDFFRKTQVQVDLILLDLMMPVMDGYRFRQEQLLDATIAAIPVVVITADGNAVSKVNQLRANGFLNKAGEINELLEVVKRHVKALN